MTKQTRKTILITGAMGFIGSAYGWYLNRRGEDNLILCDHFRNGEKWKNVRGLRFTDIILPEEAADYIRGRLPGQKTYPYCIVHLGACSSTTQTDMDFLFRNNYAFSQNLWQAAADVQIPFFYASSAATYGKGERLEDFNTRSHLSTLQPLNKYGFSKQIFDLWAEQQISQGNTPPVYAGIKFFNVFGPHEYHKGSMASVVFHAYHQIKAEGKVKLFKSYHPDYPDGGQIRDFVYIKDVCRGIDKIIDLAPINKKDFLYNLGSGKGNTFVDLVSPIFTALGIKKSIKFIDMPESLRPNYQYFTQAMMDWEEDIRLDKAVIDYVQHLESSPYLTVSHRDSYLG